MIEQLEKFVDETYLPAMERVELVEKEQDQLLERLQHIEAASASKSSALERLQREQDQLHKKLGRVSLEEIDAQGREIREDIERTQAELATLSRQRAELSGGRDMIDVRIQSANTIIHEAEEAKAELLKLRQDILAHLDKRVDAFRRTIRINQGIKSDYIRRRSEANQARREEIKSEQERRHIRKLQAEQRQARPVPVEEMAKAARSLRDPDEE